MFAIDEPFTGPTAFKLPLLAGPWVNASAGAAGMALVGSPALQINELLILPENQTTLIREGTPSRIAFDDFERDGDLAGSFDLLGNSWASPLNFGTNARFTTSLEPAVHGYAAIQQDASTDDAAAARVDVAITDAEHRILVQNLVPGAIWGLGKESATGAWMRGVVNIASTTGGYLNLAYANTPPTVIACVAIPSFAAGVHRPEIVVGHAGRQAWVSLRHASTAQVLASLGASNANFADRGYPFITAVGSVGAPVLYEYSVNALTTSGLAPADTYRIDGVNDTVWRQTNGGDWAGDLGGVRLGRTPEAPIPTSAFAAFSVPFGGAANDILAVEVRARERFRFAR